MMEKFFFFVILRPSDLYTTLAYVLMDSFCPCFIMILVMLLHWSKRNVQYVSFKLGLGNSINTYLRFGGVISLIKRIKGFTKPNLIAIRICTVEILNFDIQNNRSNLCVRIGNSI